jgi:molybdopterin converting factor small subunit
MKIGMSYFAQIRVAAGMEGETFNLPAGSGLAGAVAAAAERHGGEFKALVLDDGGAVRGSVIALVNGVPVPRSGGRPLKDGDAVSLLSAVSGG